MAQGYLYVLSNPAMPGLLKIGRTDRQPELRARELRTTGVPQAFVLEHAVIVDDSQACERQVHDLLQSRGARMSLDREFFSVDLHQAIEVLNLVAEPSNEPDFSRLHELAELAGINIYRKSKSNCLEEAEAAASKLVAIGRRGCPDALRYAALIFDQEEPHGSKFKELWREYLTMSRLYALWIPLASSNGKTIRADVGRASAEYISICEKHHWLIDDDFLFISDFLLNGDQFQYAGYLQGLSRYSLSEQIFNKARNL